MDGKKLACVVLMMILSGIAYGTQMIQKRAHAMKAEVESSTMVGAKVGMMYSRFGLFFLDIWRWNKKFVIYKDNTVWEITEEQAKEVAVDGKLDVPFTMTIPPGLLVILGGIALAVAVKLIGRKKDGGGDAPPADEPVAT